MMPVCYWVTIYWVKCGFHCIIVMASIVIYWVKCGFHCIIVMASIVCYCHGLLWRYRYRLPKRGEFLNLFHFLFEHLCSCARSFPSYCLPSHGWERQNKIKEIKPNSLSINKDLMLLAVWICNCVLRLSAHLITIF
jgi:hypothetical protein